MRRRDELTKFLPAGGDGRGIPARRAGATAVTSALGAEDGWGNPSRGPGPRQLAQTAAVLLTVLFAAATLRAQLLSGPALIKSLQAGGNVIVMRHASSPGEIPQVPNLDNVPPERQLDEIGRATTTAMGEALRRLKIPIADVMTSPTYRARETARRIGLPNLRSIVELGEGTGNMQAVSTAQTEWLQKRVREFPRAGMNTLLITHVPNISAAFPDVMPAVAQGEALVFGSDGKGGARVVGRIKIEEWAAFR